MLSAEQEPPHRPRVACVVVTYNRDDFITTCIASLLRDDGDALGIDVTVINNGATDNTAQVLGEIDDPRVTIRTNARNTALTLVLNEGLEAALASGADYILLLNDDIEMQPGAIGELMGVCQAEGASIVTPLQINYRKPDEIDGAMRKLLGDTPEILDDLLLKGSAKRYYHQRTLIGAALFASAETYRAIGDFDPAFLFYGLDDDYANRAMDMGIPRLAAMRAHMLHMHGKANAAPNVSKKDWLWRWSAQYRARAIFGIKSRERSFNANYIRVLARTAYDVFGFLLKRFPGGSMTAARTLVLLASQYKTLAARNAFEAERLAAYRNSTG